MSRSLDMYFASDRAGSRKLDFWVAARQPAGELTAVRNVAEVNRDEADVPTAISRDAPLSAAARGA